MTLLAAPPPRIRPFKPRTMPAAPAAPVLELPNVAFFGRTLAEYTKFFALDLAALRGRDVLDVAAGPSSFAAEACPRRIDAVALDPFYGGPADDLAARIDSDYTRVFDQVRAHRQMFKVGPRPIPAADGAVPVSAPGNARYFTSIDEAEAERRLAAQRFLADYETHFSHGRYVGGALPHLPFFDRTFDLVLCAHLLFIYSSRFDFEWHLTACQELVRVSDNEVRIHPICGPDGRPYTKLPALRRELRTVGIESSIVDVDYEFFAGSNAMLVLRRAA